MSGVQLIKDSEQLTKIMEMSQDKLVVLLYYGNGNSNCKYAKKAHDQLSNSHSLSLFCMIDVDNFEGNNQIINSITNLPRIDFYYQSVNLGTYSGTDAKELDQRVRAGQQYVMSQMNQKNNIGQGQMYAQGMQPGFNPMNQMNQVNQMMPGFNQQMAPNQLNQFNQFNPSQLNPQMYQQIQAQVLASAMAQNPMYHKQLLQNPQLLQQAVTQQIMMMNNSSMQPNQINSMQPNQINSMQPNQINSMQPNQINSAPQLTPLNNMLNMASSLGNAQSNSSSLNTEIGSVVAPTFQQMQHMFQIWEMMHQMGILKTNVAPKPVIQPSNSVIGQTVKQEMILPTGDKIVPLGDGKYGLIKKAT
jgi:hypothetical protein